MDIKRGNIFLADLNPTVGSEQNGIRPVVIVQNDIGNKYSPTVIIVAVTSKLEKRSLPTHVRLENVCLAKNPIALLEQVRTIDKSRLLEYIGSVSEEELSDISKALSVSLDI